jgi:tRNA1Val (adenine37-N6)-methyltransferase
MEGETANIVLVHCVKNGGAELKIMDPLYVYKEKGIYSDEIQTIYERVK